MVRRISKIALVIAIAMLVQPFCPALTFEPQSSEVASPEYPGCHDSMPEMPQQPEPSKTCCAVDHSQIAKPAVRYVAPEISPTDEQTPVQPLVISSHAGPRPLELLRPQPLQGFSAILRI